MVNAPGKSMMCLSIQTVFIGRRADQHTIGDIDPGVRID
jgi:hypothetical protein